MLKIVKNIKAHNKTIQLHLQLAGYSDILFLFYIFIAKDFIVLPENHGSLPTSLKLQVLIFKPTVFENNVWH